MDREELELQLEVWKDLAINKQMLIGAAAEALGINPDCDMDEIKSAFESATQRATQADGVVAKAQSEAAQAVAAMEKKVKASEHAKIEAEEQAAEANKAKSAAEQRVDAGREANANALKKANQQITDRDRSLKQIKKILADSPENVIKKLKALKKEKMDESNARKKAEEEARRQKKDKQKTEQSLKDLEANLQKCAELVTAVRDLKKFSEAQYDQLKDLVDDPKKLDKTPKLDEELLEAIEKSSNKEDETKDSKPKKKDTKSKSNKKKAKKK